MSEHLEQCAVMQWAQLHEKRYPALELLFAIPNGGARHPAVAGKLQAEGVKPGIPDIFLSVARGGFHGLYIEMKYGKNKTSEKQDEKIARLREEGYRVEVCYSAGEAIDVLQEYLGSARLQRSRRSHRTST